MEGTVGALPELRAVPASSAATSARSRCVHVETADVFCDGMLVEPTDSCPLQPPERH